MFLAIIPFIADGVADDWPKAVACLERTLGSILGNPERDLRAIVICQDKPPLRIKDERYLFLESKHPKPNRQDDIMSKQRDKASKVTLGYDAARNLSPEYVMIVDADDLISNALVSYVYQRPQFDAFCLKRGYEWREGSSYFTLRRNFNQVSGSAFVCRFNERLFPAFLGGGTKMICELGHNQVEAALDAEGLLVDKVYEPKAVYVTGHVNNMTRVFQNLTIKSRIKNLVLSPWRDRKLTPELKAEFGLIREPIN